MLCERIEPETNFLNRAAALDRRNWLRRSPVNGSTIPERITSSDPKENSNMTTRRRLLRAGAGNAALDLSSASSAKENAQTTPCGVLHWDETFDVIVVGSGALVLSSTLTGPLFPHLNASIRRKGSEDAVGFGKSFKVCTNGLLSG